jgi:hypothetical protein
VPLETVISIMQNIYILFCKQLIFLLVFVKLPDVQLTSQSQDIYSSLVRLTVCWNNLNIYDRDT